MSEHDSSKTSGTVGAGGIVPPTAPRAETTTPAGGPVEAGTSLSPLAYTLPPPKMPAPPRSRARRRRRPLWFGWNHLVDRYLSLEAWLRKTSALTLAALEDRGAERGQPRTREAARKRQPKRRGGP